MTVWAEEFILIQTLKQMVDLTELVTLVFAFLVHHTNPTLDFTMLKEGTAIL